MKLFKKFALTLTALGVASLGLANTVFAIDTTVINEKWGKPIVVYGGGLSDQQADQTAKLLKISNKENVNVEVATGQDLIKFLGSGDGNSSSMISSVLVQKQDPGKGVDVQILTPDNITLITAQQYANAAITAGVTDAKIEVASISKVTGESALTGVYKAFEANGETLDTSRTEVAQEELETTNKISQENAKTEGFDPARLDQAMIEIKQALADLKTQTDKLATKEDIERIVNEALANNKLQSVVSQENINQIVNFASNYQQTSAIDSNQVKEQLNQLSQTVTQKFGELVNRAQNEGWLDKIGQFFQQLFESIKNLFSGQ
ncbi:DUF1002 domain-containing protein [Granulicatella sp. s8]|uniref:DUF1002 domain-containing protein n=2 Tax=Granulicatella seriolae TaxID=2967226 RepID=A0ABT1WL55_9LACT|nr:DUF1002 domain-containing protein [Granulicatella seriolae]